MSTGLETVENLANYINEYSKEKQSKEIEPSKKDYYRGVEVAAATILKVVKHEKKIEMLNKKLEGE